MDIKKIIMNIFIIIVLAVVILMVVGIFLYDYIPSSNTVKEANTYETSSEVTAIVAEIADTKAAIENSDSSTTSTIILKTYSITETDLALYEATGSYVSGRSDPFKDVTASDTSSSSSSGSSSSGDGSSTSDTSSNTTSSNTTSSSSSDGTLFNSTKTK